MPCDPVGPRDQKAMQFYGTGSLMVGHHPNKYGDHRHRGSGDMMFLVVESQDSIRYYYFSLKHMHAMLTHKKLQDIETIISQCV